MRELDPKGLDEWRCAKCGCRSFARVDAANDAGNFEPGPDVRCVSCKDVSFHPDAPSPSYAEGYADGLEAAASLIESGADRQITTPWFPDGRPSKHDKCAHDKWAYEDCEQCAVLGIRALPVPDKGADGVEPKVRVTITNPGEEILGHFVTDDGRAGLVWKFPTPPQEPRDEQ